MTPFWYGWPSIIVEIGSGILTVALTLGWSLWYQRLIWATFFSFLYEIALDQNGWNLGDVAQREIGIVIGIVLFYYAQKWQRSLGKRG